MKKALHLRKAPLPMAAALMGLLAAPGAAAERPFRMDQAVGASINGLGVQHVVDFRWSRSLAPSPHPLLSDRRVAVGASHAITPAYTRLSGWVEVSPLAILDVRMGAEAAGYFGTFGSLQSFQGYDDRFDDETRRREKDGARKGGGSRLFLSPTLKFRAGPFVATSTADIERWRSGAAGPYYYEPARDTVLRSAGDRVLTVSTMALRLQGTDTSGQFGYGLRHSLTRVFNAPQNRSQRLGIVFMRQFPSSTLGGRAPRLVGHVSYYIEDPNRRRQLGAGIALSIRLTR